MVLNNEIIKNMNENLLHINIDKSVYMYFRNNSQASERLTCARQRQYGPDSVLKIRNHKIKKVDNVRFLGVIIDEKLTWEHHIENLTKKLNLSMIIIKRIAKFVSKSEYMKIYDSLFKSHLSYCISTWGGIPAYKLQDVFRIQKRVIRLLFGKQYTFDHAGFYETCARVRTYKENTSPKNYSLEHTKPIFNEYNILSIYNIYAQRTFIDLFKVFKIHSPISIFSLFEFSERDTSHLIKLPQIKLNVSKSNYVFSSSIIWNNLVGQIFETCQPNKNSIIVEGSQENSDFCSTVPFVKQKLKNILLSRQKLGEPSEWESSNFCVSKFLPSRP